MKTRTKILVSLPLIVIGFGPPLLKAVAPPRHEGTQKSDECRALRNTLHDLALISREQAAHALTRGLLAEKVSPETIIKANRQVRENKRIRQLVDKQFRGRVEAQINAVLFLAGCPL